MKQQCLRPRRVPAAAGRAHHRPGPRGPVHNVGPGHEIGTEFGISEVLISSHLLGEIEQICDHLVVIDSGAAARPTR